MVTVPLPLADSGIVIAVVTPVPMEIVALPVVDVPTAAVVELGATLGALLGATVGAGLLLPPPPQPAATATSAIARAVSESVLRIRDLKR